MAFAAIGSGTLVSGCGGPESTGIEFAPQMYHSIPLEPYSQIDGNYAAFPDSMNAQLPPDGTIPYGTKYFPSLNYAGLKPDSERVAAGLDLKNPVPLTDGVMKEGEMLYTRFCSLCHGATGNADGPVAKRSDLINPTKFPDKDTTQLRAGEVFYNMTYGKNAMGSHSSQLTVEERWKVVHFVQTLQKKPVAAPPADAATPPPAGITPPPAGNPQ